MQKYVNIVDLAKSFPTSIYLQKSALIPPRTSPSKFGGKFNSSFICLLGRDTFRVCCILLVRPPELASLVFVIHLPDGCVAGDGAVVGRDTFRVWSAEQPIPRFAQHTLVFRSDQQGLHSRVAPSRVQPMFFPNFYLTFFPNFWQTLRGPFSAVSTPNFASKYYW